MLFDFMRGADQCRSYACKYCGKPEPWYYLETSTPGGEANPVKRFLQCRNIGLCMCHNRLMGFNVVRSTVPTVFLSPQFTFDPSQRIQRQADHLENVPRYPDKFHYLQEIQKYFFRSEQLRHLRPHQFFRYFTQRDNDEDRASTGTGTHENTMPQDDEKLAMDDKAHRNYDEQASLTTAGEQFNSARYLPHRGGM